MVTFFKNGEKTVGNPVNDGKINNIANNVKTSASVTENDVVEPRLWRKPTITRFNMRRTLGGGGSLADGGPFTSTNI